MGKIILSSIEQPLAQSAPRTNIYEGREVDLGRIRAQIQGGPEIRNGAAAGLASLAQGLSAWTGVARAWSGSRREEKQEGGAPRRRSKAQESEADQGRPEIEPGAAPNSWRPEQAVEDRDLDLDRAALLEAVRAHDGQMAAFAEGQAQLKGREAIDDPLTGNQGLTGRAVNWMKEYDQKFQPQFRRPETGEMYRQALEQRRSELVERSEVRQAGEEETWREQVFESDLDLMIQTMFQDPTPQRLADLDAEIETLWPAPEAEERRAEIRDRSYGRIAQTILDGGNLNEAEAFINQYKENFKPETVEELKQALDRKESELVLSHTALAEVLPDLAADELKAIMGGGQASEALDGLYRTAEEFWDLPAEKAAEYRRGRQAAQAANEWLARPDRAFKAFPELLAEAERELKNDDESGLSSFALVERELKKKQREFNDDPIGHVSAQRDAAINRLLAQGDLKEDQGPELTQMKIALGRSLAKKMGMEDRGLVLSWEEAKAYREQLAQAPGPAERLDVLVECDKLFGRYSGRAFRQLNIPAEEQWAARLLQQGSPELGPTVRLAFNGLRQMPPEDDQASWLTMARAASETMMSPRLQGLAGGFGAQEVGPGNLDGLCRLVSAAAGPAGAEEGPGSATVVESLLLGALADDAKKEPAKAGQALETLAELKRRPEDAAWLTEFLARKLAWAEMEKSPEAKNAFLADFKRWQLNQGLGREMPLPFNYLPGASAGQGQMKELPYRLSGPSPDNSSEPGQLRLPDFQQLQGRTGVYRLAADLVDKVTTVSETVLHQASADSVEGAVPVRDWLDDALHGFGVGTRGVLDSFLSLGDLVAAPVRALMNLGIEAAGGAPDYIPPMTGNIPDALGLPQPENSGEQLAYNASVMLGTLPVAIWAGQMLIARGVQAAGSGVTAVGEMLAAEPAGQAAAGLGAAGALTAAEEADANPIAQFFASLLGGIVGGGIKPKGTKSG